MTITIESVEAICLSDLQAWDHRVLESQSESALNEYSSSQSRLLSELAHESAPIGIDGTISGSDSPWLGLTLNHQLIEAIWVMV